MQNNKFPGLFIAVEGLDGSGLSTQARLLMEFFRKNGKRGYLTKEPTDNVIGGLIRGALSGVYNLPGEVLQLLFVSDRHHHLDRLIKPILKKGEVVICDRYFWSTVAYGSLAVNKEWLLGLNKNIVIPDVTICLKVSPKICLQKLTQDRFDFELYEKEGQLKEVWRTYKWLAKKFKNGCLLVDGEGSIDEVHQRVVGELSKHSKVAKFLKL